ncbi:hypothetical protein [Celeribacter sp.]|uniref:hypothetical protein n=1 Tax=Celeribacter sp. TaxID=1890673 RepID=UPI003A95B78E
MKRLILAAATALCLAPTAHAQQPVDSDTAYDYFLEYKACIDFASLSMKPKLKRFRDRTHDYADMTQHLMKRADYYERYLTVAQHRAWSKKISPLDFSEKMEQEQLERALENTTEGTDTLALALRGNPQATTEMRKAMTQRAYECHYLAYEVEHPE